MGTVYKRPDRGDEWYIRYYDERGRRRNRRAGPSKRAAQSLLEDLEDQVRRARAGLIVSEPESVPSLVQGYLAHLRGKDRTPEYIARVERVLGELAEAAPTLDRLTRPMAERFLDESRRRGMSAATVNRRRAALLAFGKWLDESHVLPRHPFKGLPAGDERNHRTFRRRAVSKEEFDKVLKAAGETDVVRVPKRRRDAKGKLVLTETTARMPNRGAFYELAAKSGLRVSELLSAGLAEGKGLLFVPVKSKDKRARVQPLPADALATATRIFKETPRPFEAIGRAKNHLAAAIRFDCERAGVDPEGVDLHALRHTYCTWLVSAGVQPSVLRELARHRDLRTTLEYYAHVTRKDVEEAVNSL